MMRISVQVKTDARKEAIEERAPGRFEVSVREEAERNMANRRVIQLVAHHFGVRESAVRIIKGQRSMHKTLTVQMQ